MKDVIYAVPLEYESGRRILKANWTGRNIRILISFGTNGGKTAALGGLSTKVFL